MPRIFLLWLVLAAAVGGGVYQLKYEVQRLERRLTAANREILAEQEAIHILKAEWSYLNTPKQLSETAKRHLSLEPMQGRQFATLAQIPIKGDQAKPLPAPPPKTAPLKPADIEEDATPGAPEDEDELPAAAPAPAPSQLLLVRGGVKG